MAWMRPNQSSMSFSTQASTSTQLAKKLVSASPAMASVVEALEKASNSDSPVLLEGEQGVGKEFVARLIHLSSYRRENAFETLLPPALPAQMAAEELFGVQARKLRQAAGGTLLLKEVWRFPSAVQRRLAEALALDTSRDQTPIAVHDVWLMMSSRVALEDASREGLLAPPLANWPKAGWKNVQRIHIPPLRRRPADIPRLVELFNLEHAEEMDRPPLSFPGQIIDRFAGYSWPGNVSELKSVIYRLHATHQGSEVEESHLAGLLPQVEDELPLSRFGLEDLVRAKLRTFLARIRGYHVEDLHAQVLSQVERPLMELVLEQTSGNQLQAAKVLGINRNTLRKKIRNLGIRLPR